MTSKTKAEQYTSVELDSPTLSPETHSGLRHDGNEKVNFVSGPSPPTTSMYPPRSFTHSNNGSTSEIPLDPNSRRPQRSEDIELQGPSGLPYDAEKGNASHRPAGSWDVLRKFNQDYEEFDTRNASENHLVFAEGDMAKNKISKFYLFLLNASIVTRWLLFIVPVLGLLWIPGIIQLTLKPNATVWYVPLLWWSIWLSVAWGGWWVALAASRILPVIIRSTVGVVAVGTRRYIDWAMALHRYVALLLWSLACWVTYQPLIDNKQKPETTDKSRRAVDLIAKILFGIFLCSALLVAEKFTIQFIAGKFHERSYAERIADQKFAVKTLVTLYRQSSDQPGRQDGLRGAKQQESIVNPKRIFRQAIKGVRAAATHTTTVFGNVASEIAGSSVLQPNSPQAMVKTALESANQSRKLARRIFFSFAHKNAEYLLVDNIRRLFATPEEATQAFTLFDKDSNGDATLEEMEMALMDFHREQLSLEHSMSDLDSAVGRLDNILMSLYVVIAIVIIAVCLEASVATLIASAGTLVLGLSWLIGASLAEVLTSIIFLFVKHPFDVGDRVDLSGKTYTVKEIRLLSTVFLDSQSVYVQAPNVILNGMFIHNIRRSGQMSETFKFDVAYTTSFDDLEMLRDRMLKFLEDNKRDYMTSFDVAVLDFPEQSSMAVSADIKYKSNSQQGSLKAKRRNRWICALKTHLTELKIFGPSGNPDSGPSVTRYTQVPWEHVQAEERRTEQEKAAALNDTQAHVGTWRLSDRNAFMQDDVFGDASRFSTHPTPSRAVSSSAVPTMPVAATMPVMPTAQPAGPAVSPAYPAAAAPYASGPGGGAAHASAYPSTELNARQ